MKRWVSTLIFSFGIGLVVFSFFIFGLRIWQTTIPTGSTQEQIAQMTQKYGLDRPIYEQYQWFLFTFLPGLILVALYVTVFTHGWDYQHWILVQIFIILMLITNTVTVLNYLVNAHASLQDAQGAFWLTLVPAGLALANFAFLLVTWNGKKWGVWAFGITSFVLCTLKFVGHIPIFPVLFEFSSVIILIYLLRTSWPYME